jgi:hypothetical protein
MNMDNVIRQSTDPCIIFKPSFVTPRTPPQTRPPLYRSLGDDDTGHPEPNRWLSEPKAASDSSSNACDRKAEPNDQGSQLTETKRCDKVYSQLEESGSGGIGTTTQDVEKRDSDRQMISSTVSRPFLHSGIGVTTQMPTDLGGINAGMRFFQSITYTIKKVIVLPVPAGMLPTKLSLAGNNLIIPAGEGENDNLFLQCTGSR